jgi:hypothetical protein
MALAGVKVNMANPFHAALKTGFHAYRDDITSEDEDAATSLAGCWDNGRDWLYAILRGEIRFPATMLPDWIRVTGDYSALHWICDQVDVIPVRMRNLPAGQNTANVVQEFGRYLQEVAEDDADGEITNDEAIRIRKRGETAIAAIIAEVEHCERRAAQGGRATQLADAS